MAETKLKSQALEVDELRAPSTSHLTLTPGTNKLVKVAVLRQDNTTDTYKNNQVILTGWGYKLGIASTVMSESVSFGLTFSDVPIVVCTGGMYTTSTPTGLNSFSGQTQKEVIGLFGITTTGFNVGFARTDTNNFNTGANYGYTWIAIGTL